MLLDGDSLLCSTLSSINNIDGSSVGPKFRRENGTVRSIRSRIIELDSMNWWLVGEDGPEALAHASLLDALLDTSSGIHLAHSFM
jgi:hypothetical protein